VWKKFGAAELRRPRIALFRQAWTAGSGIVDRLPAIARRRPALREALRLAARAHGMAAALLSPFDPLD